jgi:hypothetical protein
MRSKRILEIGLLHVNNITIRESLICLKLTVRELD